MSAHKYGGYWTPQKLGVLEKYLNAYTEALSQALGATVVTGTGPLIQTAKTPDTSTHFESARKLVERGESLYMRFEFGPAAASLAEAAALLTILAVLAIARRQPSRPIQAKAAARSPSTPMITGSLDTMICVEKRAQGVRD